MLSRPKTGKPFVFPPFLAIISTALLYLAFALLAEIVTGSLAVWPAAGAALAAIMIFGPVCWPGLFLGSAAAMLCHFLLKSGSFLSWEYLIILLVTATGNTIATLIAYRCHPDRLFVHSPVDHLHKRVGMFTLAMLAIGFLSAIPAIGIYFLLGITRSFSFYHGVLGLAVANMIGVIAVTPFLYLLRFDFLALRSSLISREGMILILATCTIGFFIFGPGYSLLADAFLQPSLPLIPLIWAVLRKPPLAVTFLNLLTFLLAWAGTSFGYGYFHHSAPESAETSMVIALGLMLSTILILDIVLIHRRQEWQNRTDWLQKKVQERTAELEKARQIAEYQACTDPMTSLNNRRAFFMAADQMFKTYPQLAVLMLDIDHFKKVNDTYGHDIGDQVIISLAASLRVIMPPNAILGRLGGEEFAIILPDTHQTENLAEKLRQEIARMNIQIPSGQLHITISIGIAYRSNQDQNIGDLLKQADTALYRAKNQGRNQVILYESKNTSDS